MESPAITLEISHAPWEISGRPRLIRNWLIFYLGFRNRLGGLD
ncbi:hypothetical protein C4J93_2191 [Pseudomonas sp. R2-37-08W]|nr:hypothetical protein C4J93_2191 [Pseudomonas sp. R2-37-08W]